MNIDEITKIAQLMTKHDLTEFSIESEELKLCLKRDKSADVQLLHAAVTAPDNTAQVSSTASPAASQKETEPAAAGAQITSPIVGTFYASASPDAAPFVKVGDYVDEDSVVCIVEAMKVMNEIKAEACGTISKILVENGTPVEYGQAIFELEPA